MRVVRKITATSKSGKHYTIVECATDTSFTSVTTGIKEIIKGGGGDFYLDNGDPVNQISGTEYLIVLTGEQVTIDT